VIRLTQLRDVVPDIQSRMAYTDWLRAQVERLENEVREHSVFDSSDPASASQLEELRSKVVIHTYLKQQLLRRETVRPTAPVNFDELGIEIDLDVPPEHAPDFDTQEFVLVLKDERRQALPRRQ
jgi:hypothetical protein